MWGWAKDAFGQELNHGCCGYDMQKFREFNFIGNSKQAEVSNRQAKTPGRTGQKGQAKAKV